MVEEDHQFDDYQFDVAKHKHIAKSVISAFVTRVFSWMFLALFVTTCVALLVTSSESFMVVASRGIWFFIILEFLVVFVIGMFINKISHMVAVILFLLYSSLNGITFGVLISIFTPHSVGFVLGLTTVIFAVMAIYGYFTKEDLSKFINVLNSGLIILIVTSIINIFIRTPFLYWLVSYLGVIIFVGLIGYDVNRIKNQAVLSVNGDSELLKKYSIFGALQLYLDFINLFIFLLRIFGRSKD